MGWNGCFTGKNGDSAGKDIPDEEKSTNWSANKKTVETKHSSGHNISRHTQDHGDSGASAGP